ncbi:type IV toxin-antitoxin system AbiEi family antitoxin domain-containing protein [Kineosporia mesophila]|uniref:type IV toxin-antitoxin system AbiEi family antitoxin domain-containing protein n=1 Tax=Kineosporia mesophila TaxID=566012 RepID=UPI0038B24D93
MDEVRAGHDPCHLDLRWLGLGPWGGRGALPATFTPADARPAGIHQRDVYQWRDAGQILELSRGVFRQADALRRPAPTFSLWLVGLRAPRSAWSRQRRSGTSPANCPQP